MESAPTSSSAPISQRPAGPVDEPLARTAFRRLGNIALAETILYVAWQSLFMVLRAYAGSVSMVGTFSGLLNILDKVLAVAAVWCLTLLGRAYDGSPLRREVVHARTLLVVALCVDLVTFLAQTYEPREAFTTTEDRMAYHRAIGLVNWGVFLAGRFLVLRMLHALSHSTTSEASRLITPQWVLLAASVLVGAARHVAIEWTSPIAVVSTGIGLVAGFLLWRTYRLLAGAPLEGRQDSIPREAPRDDGGRDLLVGALWAGGGLLVTLWSMSAAPGGRMVITWGALLYGVVRIIRGLSKRG